jgi:hypothetical protein
MLASCSAVRSILYLSDRCPKCVADLTLTRPALPPAVAAGESKVDGRTGRACHATCLSESGQAEQTERRRLTSSSKKVTVPRERRNCPPCDAYRRTIRARSLCNSPVARLLAGRAVACGFRQLWPCRRSVSFNASNFQFSARVGFLWSNPSRASWPVPRWHGFDPTL